MNELVIHKGCHHEEGIVYAAGNVTLEDRIAYMPAPNRQSLALILFKVASPDDRPPGVAGKYQPTRLHLVIDIHKAG